MAAEELVPARQAGGEVARGQAAFLGQLARLAADRLYAADRVGADIHVVEEPGNCHMRNGRITDPALGDLANAALTRPGRPVNRYQGRDVNPLGGCCYQQFRREERVMYHKRWALAGAAATALSVLAGLAMAAPAGRW
jgi:hypothetical protein